MSCDTSMSALWSDGSWCVHNSHKTTDIIKTMSWPNIEQDTRCATLNNIWKFDSQNSVIYLKKKKVGG